MTLATVIDRPIDPLALHGVRPDRYPFLLESVVRNPRTARWSIVFAFPGETLAMSDPVADGDFLLQLDEHWRRYHGPVPPETAHLPFHGGWFLYLGYELAGQVEPTLVLPPSETGAPIAFATRIPAAVIVDHYSELTWLVVEPGQEHLLALLRTDVDRAARPFVSDRKDPCTAAIVEDDPTPYLEALARIKRYIVDGDVFQVNLSRAWRARLQPGFEAADLYDRLRRSNPAPFAGLARFGHRAVLSSSPERLVSVRAGRVDTRPIAGTRRRGSGSEDDELSKELLAHPKERAEHVMLIDLERNDIGRVCQPGTVRVDELMVLESYAHVHHIVSNVTGLLADGVSPGQVIRAVFPGGTITGCPKVRCMEILAELEGVGRGPYTGSMGYLNRDGSLDLNILIRTISLCGGQLLLRAGGGIVADSVPDRELAETRAKARGLLLALGALDRDVP